MHLGIHVTDFAICTFKHLGCFGSRQHSEQEQGGNLFKSTATFCCSLEVELYRKCRKNRDLNETAQFCKVS